MAKSTARLLAGLTENPEKSGELNRNIPRDKLITGLSGALEILKKRKIENASAAALELFRITILPCLSDYSEFTSTRHKKVYVNSLYQTFKIPKKSENQEKYQCLQLS